MTVPRKALQAYQPARSFFVYTRFRKGGRVLKHYLVLLATLAIITLGTDAAPARWRTFGQFNGHWWTSSPELARAGYLCGYMDGVVEAQWPTPVPEPDYGVVFKGIHRFYDQPENINITVRDAIHIFAMKVAGESQSRIEEETRAAREKAKAGVTK